tara:strand:+ start:1267 stop:2928 length:1662 start_codon:yes stop_codon:yes gene_type:complete
MASSNSLTGKKISETYGSLLKRGSGNNIVDGYGNEVDIHFPKDVTISGSLTATSFITSQSIVNTSSGSTAFGNTDDDTHIFTGDVYPSIGGKYQLGLQDKPWKEVYVDSGSLIIVSGSETSLIQFLEGFLQFDTNVSASVTGELFGTASNAASAAFADSATIAVSALVADNVFATMSVSSSDGSVNELRADSGKDVLNFSGSNIVINSDVNTDTLNFDLTDTVRIKSGIYVGDNIVGASQDNFWVQNGDKISYSLGNVGINDANPSVALQVAGDISASGDLYIMGKSLVGQLETEGIIGSLGFVTGGIAVTGDLKVQGDVSAETFTVSSSIVSESIVYQSGSTKFGDTQDDRHDFTGSLDVSGSIVVTDRMIFDEDVDREEVFSLDIAGYTGSVSGTIARIGNVGDNDGAIFMGGGENDGLPYRSIDATTWDGSSNRPLYINSRSDSGDNTTYFGGDVWSGNRKLGSDNIWKQDTQIVDYSFISLRTSSLANVPVDNSENVYFNGLRLTKDSGSYAFDYSMSLNDKHVIFNEEIIFKSGDLITIKYQYDPYII